MFKINSEELRKEIGKKGLKLKYVADKLNLSPYGLALKIDNVNEFKNSEILILSNVLELDLKQKEKIFFASKVN